MQWPIKGRVERVRRDVSATAQLLDGHEARLGSQRRIAEQDAVLDQAAPFVKPGGRLVYVTCSILAEENEDRLAAFRERHPGFAVKPVELADLPVTPEGYLRMTPLRTGTDGFFVAVLERSATPFPLDGGRGGDGGGKGSG